MTGILELLIIILLLCWLLGAFAFPIVAVGNWVHLLLLIVLILVVARILEGRKPLP